MVKFFYTEGEHVNIGYSMNYCSKLLKNRLNKELEKQDITVAQFAVIKDIEINSSRDGCNIGVTAVEIAERLDMDKPTISGIINRLVDRGYIKKSPHPQDGRSSILKLTEYCIEKLPDFELINERVVKEAIEGLNDNELQTFQDIINKIIDNLK